MEPQFEKLEKVTAPQYVVESIQNAMQKGELRIGDKLPSEMDLCASLGVGRSSLREGIKVLTTYGILEVKQGQGTFVTDNFVENIFDILGFVPIGENLIHFHKFRAILECGCMRIVYDKFTPEECDELEELAASLDPQKDTDFNIEQDKRFHDTLVQHAENPILLRSFRMTRKINSYIMDQLMCHDDVVLDARTSHLEIVDALRKKDRELCEEVMEKHQNKAYSHKLKYMP